MILHEIFIYHDILISVLHCIVHCVINTLHVIMLLSNNKFDLMNTFILMPHGHFRAQVDIVI